MQANPTEAALMARQRVDDEAPSAAARLLARIRAGDIGAFEELMMLHERRVLRTAFRLLGHLEDAEDAAQEVFLRFYKYLARFDDTRELSPWLYRMTVNICRDLARKRPSQAVLSLEDVQLDQMPTALETDDGASLSERRRIVAEGLKTLPEKERAALVLRDIEGLSTKEVARVLGSSEMTVRSQVSRARVKMKKFVERVLRRQP